MKTDLETSYGGRLWPDPPHGDHAPTARPQRSGPPRRPGALALIVGFVAVAALVIGGIAFEPDRGTDAPIGTDHLTTDSSARTPEAKIQPQAVARVQASAEPWSVRLTWTAPRGGESVDHFVLKRSGVSIGSTSNLAFDDDDVLPGGSYEYLVVAVSAGGAESRPTHITVRTPNATQSEPAIVGTYSFQMHATSLFGYTKDTYKGTTWIRVEFDPACGAGCSSVSFHYTDSSDISGVMHRTWDGFAGTTTGDWGVTCGKKAQVSRFSWDISVLSTSPDNSLDQLVADELRATVKVSEPARDGCRASGVILEGTAA